MSASRRCQQLLWQVAASGGWSDEVLVLGGGDAMQMAVDPHWNFLLQQVVTLCTAGQLEVFCARLSGRVLKLSKDDIGCRLLCRICEQGKFLEAARQLLEELASDISELIVHKYGNFVVVKIMENFVNFPGMEDALLATTQRFRFCGFTCTGIMSDRLTTFLFEGLHQLGLGESSKPVHRCWTHGVTLSVLLKASERGQLRAVHYEAIAARRDFETLKTFRTHGKELYAATLSHLTSSIEQGEEKEMPGEVNLAPLQESFPLVCYACHPVFCNYYTPEGAFIGALFQGYQVVGSVGSVGTVIFPQQTEQPAVPEPSGSSPQRVTWTGRAREVKKIFHGGPPTVHLGVAPFRGQRYSLDLVPDFQAKKEDGQVFYRAAIKRLGASADSITVMLSFEGQLPMHHDFAQHVCVSPLMTMSRSGLLEAEGNFSMSVGMSTF